MRTALTATARAQAGCFSPLQARSAKVHHDVLDKWVQSGIVRRVHDVYVVEGAPASELQACWIAVLAVGKRVALRGLTAAWLRKVPGIKPPEVPQLLVPSTRTPSVEGIADVRRVGDWSAYTISKVDGLPVLAPLDTVLTSAPQLSDAALLRVLQDLCFRGEIDLVALAQRRRRGLPGSDRLGRVLATYLLGHDSTFESFGYGILNGADLAPDHCNVIIVAPDGNRVGPVDGYFEAEGVAYDLDGRRAHDARARRERDAKKVVHASEVGVLLRRFGPDEVADHRGFIAALRAQLRGREAPPGLEVEHLPGRSCPCGHVARSA